MTFTLNHSRLHASTKMLAIMTVMPKELEDLVSATGPMMTIQRVAMRDFYLGETSGQPCEWC